MRALHLIGTFARVSAQEELAYRANFWISLLHSLLGLITGVLGLVVLFDQIETVRGWDFASSLALLGVFLTLGALRNLFIGPSLDALAGMEGAIWRGTFDFTLLRPLNPQFMVSFQRWRPFALVDLLLGLGVLVVALAQMNRSVGPVQLLAFVFTLASGGLILYSVLLALTSLVFWGPGFFYTWLFDALFQMARYPVGLYPGWIRLVLTWIIPVGIMTTVPAQALAGTLSPGLWAGSLLFSLLLFVGASRLFQANLRRYASASS
jgi:ABC-2 type transport system permease protein